MRAQGKHAEGSQAWVSVLDGVESLLGEGASRGQLQRELGHRRLPWARRLELQSPWATHSPQRNSRKAAAKQAGPGSQGT